MMAGQVRLKVFLAYLGAGLIACVGAGAVAGALGAFSFLDAAPEAVPVAEPVRVQAVPTAPTAPALPSPPTSDAAPTPAASADAPAASAGDEAARAVDRVVASYLGVKDLGTDKLKDVTSGKPYKLNVYQDTGAPTANRAKLDLDRDEKWDEKYTWKEGRLERQVAPADDEAYTRTLVWTGGGWDLKE